MEMETKQKRRRKISKKRKRNRPPSAEPTSINDLTDDLLELVLLVLDSPVCLLRAASACKRWCRVVGDSAFLDRFRSLHPARPLGHFYNVNNDLPCPLSWIHSWPEEPPVYDPTSESTAAGTGIDLSLDFVPYAGGQPEIVDSRGSLLLLLKKKKREPFPNCGCCDHRAYYFIPDLVVCEPTTRRYQKMDPPRDPICILSAFLLDGQGSGSIGMTSFRVLLVLYDHDLGIYGDRYNGHGYVSAYVSTGGSNGGWRYHSDATDDRVYLPHLYDVHVAGRTGGRIYWGCHDRQIMVLFEHTLKFSTMYLPDYMKMNFSAGNIRVVSGEGGTARIVRVTDGGDLQVFNQLYGASADDWVIENRICLAEINWGLPGRKQVYLTKPAKIIRAGDRIVVLSLYEKKKMKKKKVVFTVDLHTMELKPELNRYSKFTGPAFPCMPPWPPVFSRSC